MALDRVIEVDYLSIGPIDEHGEQGPAIVDSTVTMWASITDGGTVDSFVGGAQITQQRKTFQVRYRADLLDYGPLLLEVRDEHGDRFNVENVVDFPHRRRFIQIRGINVRE